MKRFVLAFAALLTSVSLFCQIEREFDSEYFPRNEIYIQYGTPSVLELATTLQKETSYIGKEYLGESKNYIFSGIGGLGYNFNIDKRFSVGVYFGVGYSSADLYITHIGGTTFVSRKLCTSEILNYTANISGHLTYWSEGSMELSSGLYLGVSYLDETVQQPKDPIFDFTDSDGWKFSYHFTALKFRYGELFGFFAELGFGYRGLVNVGLSVKI